MIIESKKKWYTPDRIREHKLIDEKDHDDDYRILFDNEKGNNIDILEVSTFVVMSREYRHLDYIDEVLDYCIEVIDEHTNSDLFDFEKFEIVAFEEKSKDPKSENYVRVAILHS